MLLERLVASSNEHGAKLEEQSTLLKGAVEVLTDRLTAMEASLGGLHAKRDALATAAMRRGRNRPSIRCPSPPPCCRRFKP